MSSPSPFSDLRILRRLRGFAVYFLPWLLLFVGETARGAGIGDFQFKADFYRRDLQTNTIKGKGHAWLKKGAKEIWADELEVDFTSKRAVANGNVHLRDGDIDIWCNHLSQNLESDEAVLEEATLVNGQIVFTGAQIRRLDRSTFEIQEGTYSNCNVDLLREPNLGKCDFDWKMYGRRFSITLEEYAHIHDVLVYVKNAPVLYLPYFIAPVKTKRQSGFLLPAFTWAENLGSGTSLPFFWAIAPWHDLLIQPTYWSKTGYHLGLRYRYVYSDDKRGEINAFIIQRRFSADRNNPGVDDTSRNRALGFIGEWAIDARNVYSLGGRAQTRQTLRLVSDPYYTLDHGSDFLANYDGASFRSLFAVTYPTDSFLFAGMIRHFQSLIISKDRGVDRGAVTELPTLTASQTNTSLLSRYVSYEIDSRLSNFYRPGIGYDSVPAGTTSATTVHVDPIQDFHSGDYIRVGRRANLEPRLVANVPMPSGFQLQPVVKAGTLVYHFDFPNSDIVHKEYLQTEIPISMYLSKGFETSIPGFERINHVFQPRIVYGRSLYESNPNHPFFDTDSPKFDLLDQVVPFEYMRFELINRFRRKVDRDVSRFLRIQLSEQYNIRTVAQDSRYAKRLGPVELLAELGVWRFAAQVQARYQLETTDAGGDQIRENDVSASLTYRSGSDLIQLNNRTRIQANPDLTEKNLYLFFYKGLPTFFDLDGELEYSYKKGELGRYRVGFIFGSKPRSCWGFTLSLGRNVIKQPFASFQFRLDFGLPEIRPGS